MNVFWLLCLANKFKRFIFLIVIGIGRMKWWQFYTRYKCGIGHFLVG